MGISPAEVRLRRLLAATPQQSNQAKLLHYMVSMREQLAELKGETGQDDLPIIPASKAEAYAKRIDDLAEKLNVVGPVMDVWESLRAEDEKSVKPAGATRRAVLEAEEAEQSLLGPQTLSPTLRRRRYEREQQGQDKGQAVRLDAATTRLVDKHRLIQDALIDEMASFSEQLKNNSLMMDQSLKETERVLDRTDEAVEHSLSATNRANVRAALIHKSSWKTGCFTWLILVLMILIFVFMIGVIRITG